MRLRETTQNLTDKRLLSPSEACIYSGLGRSKMRELAEQAGAVKRFGRRVLIDKVKLDAAIDEL